jgi:putative tricarboxylic transport membrane protein
MNRRHVAVGAGTFALGVLIVAGATSIRSDAGYGGVGPNFLPWVVGLALLACGAFLVWEALSGGFRLMEAPSGAEVGHWPGFVWVSVGILCTAALITRIGFVLACGLCFMLAVRGFKSAQGRIDRSPVSWLVDLLIGMAIAAPVYWLFGKLLAINLPGLTNTGWI